MKTTNTKWTIHKCEQLGVKLESTLIVRAGECKITINQPLTGSKATPKEAKEIAKLIAAAPELLEVAMILKRYVDVGEQPTEEEIHIMDTAIQKATS